MHFNTHLQLFLQEESFAGHQDRARNLADWFKMTACLLNITSWVQ